MNKEEIRKCQESPAYFYNNYTEQGKKNPVKDEEFWRLLAKYSDKIIFIAGRGYNRTGRLKKFLQELEKQENNK